MSQLITIKRGPYAGFGAEVVAKSSTGMFVCNVNIFGKWVSCQFDSLDLYGECEASMRDFIDRMSASELAEMKRLISVRLKDMRA